MDISRVPSLGEVPMWAGLECYCMTKGTAYKAVQFMTTTNWVSGAAKIFANPADYVASMRIFPFKIVTFPTPLELTTMTAAGVTFHDPNNISVLLQAYSLPPTMNGFHSVLDGGSLYVRQVNSNEFGSNDFRNYPPYTKYKFWIPFVGFVEVDPVLVVRETVHLRYQVDYTNGSSVWVLYTGDPDDCIVVATGEVTLGVNLPFGQNNASSAMLNGVVGTIAAVASMAATSGSSTPVAIGALQAAGAGISAAQSFHITGSAGTCSGGIGDLFSDRYFGVVIETTSKWYPENFAHSYGFPLMQTRRLSTLTGYTKVAKIHPEGIPCTAHELSEIEQLLLSGVIF